MIDCPLKFYGFVFVRFFLHLVFVNNDAEPGFSFLLVDWQRDKKNQARIFPKSTLTLFINARYEFHRRGFFAPGFWFESLSWNLTITTFFPCQIRLTASYPSQKPEY